MTDTLQPVTNNEIADMTFGSYGQCSRDCSILHAANETNSDSPAEVLKTRQVQSGLAGTSLMLAPLSPAMVVSPQEFVP